MNRHVAPSMSYPSFPMNASGIDASTASRDVLALFPIGAQLPASSKIFAFSACQPVLQIFTQYSQPLPEAMFTFGRAVSVPDPSCVVSIRRTAAAVENPSEPPQGLVRLTTFTRT